MKSIETIKSILEKVGIENSIENLPDDSKVLTFRYKSIDIVVSNPVKNSEIVQMYSIVSPASKEAKNTILRLINNYNEDYDYIKFFYQESYQGALVFASYTIPSLDSGLEHYFLVIMKKMVEALNDLNSKIPIQAVFTGRIKM